jgi:hypothetical protein
MVLQEKLRSIKMLKSESVTSYLGRFTQTLDELAAVDSDSQGFAAVNQLQGKTNS